MDGLLTFIGRFHPLIVHLPIGFILLALLLEFSKSKFKEAKKVLKFIMLWAIISGFFSIVTGYFQYLQEGYLWETVQAHFYLGLITLMFSIGFYIFLQGSTILNRLPRTFFSLGLLVAILFTGHLGGTITHGEAHLAEPLEELSSTLFGIEEKENGLSLTDENYKEQPIYSKVIAPILSKKCVSCHNSKTAKGGLQMQTFEAFQKGSKNGPIINYDNPELSELFLRIHLPLGEKKHMPPKSKKQLTKAEINLISYWIEAGTPERQTLGQLDLNRNLIEPFLIKDEVPFYPILNLEAPAPEIIKNIESKGIIISPIKRESNLLTISTLNVPKFNVRQLEELEGIREQLVSIDLSYSSVNDSVFRVLSEFPNLVQIKLNHTQITGKGIHSLSNLKYLKKLYMVETALESAALSSIKNLASIEQVFIFQSDRNLIEGVELSPDLQSILEYGNSILPKLPTDDLVY